MVELVQVDGFGLGELVRLLQASIEEDAVEVWETACDARYIWLATLCLLVDDKA